MSPPKTVITSIDLSSLSNAINQQGTAINSLQVAVGANSKNIAALRADASSAWTALTNAIGSLAFVAASSVAVSSPPIVVTSPPVIVTSPVVSGLPSDINALSRPNGTIYEWGDLFVYPGPTTPHAPYSVGSVTVPGHFYGARWYDGPFVVKNKVADLVAAKLVVPHGASIANITPRWLELGGYDANKRPLSIGYSGPMDYEMAPYMGQTGDTPFIGPFSEGEAGRIALDDASLDAHIAALAHNGLTLPIHVRDPKTGRPISYKDYPAFSVYPGQENSMIAPGLRTGILGWSPTPPGIVFDAAHHPQMFYLAGLMTDDPVWCEELQYLATFCWSFDYPENPANMQTHVDNLQVREMAWDMMTIVNAIALTRYFEKKGLLPSSCLSSQELIDVMLTPTIKWLENFFSDTTPAGYSKVLQWAPFVYAPWQWDFFGIAVACGIYYGITELKPVFDWVKQQLIQRLSTRFPTWYYTQTPTDWSAAAWDATVAGDAELQRVDDPSKPFPPALLDAYSDYTCWTGAVARMGKLIGDPDLTPLSIAYDAKLKAAQIGVNYRHSIGAAL